MKDSSKRIWYFDRLRIVAMTAVVFLHVAAQNWDKVDVNSFEWGVFNFFDSVVRWGVPVFVMISGALFLGKGKAPGEMFKKYVLKIAVVYVFWSVFYALWIRYVTHEISTFKEVILYSIRGHYHTWFLLMIAGLYMIVPLLSRLVEKERTAKYFVILAFVFASAVPQAIELIGLRFPSLSSALQSVNGSMNMSFVLGYSGFFVAGYLLNKAEISRKTELAIYALGILGAAYTVFMTAFYSRRAGAPTSAYYNVFGINHIAMTLSVFVFFKKHLKRQPRSAGSAKTLAFISKCSLGVYLAHPLAISVMNKFFEFNTMSLSPIPGVIAVSLAALIISLAISSILNLIPFVKKWIV